MSIYLLSFLNRCVVSELFLFWSTFRKILPLLETFITREYRLEPSLITKNLEELLETIPVSQTRDWPFFLPGQTSFLVRSRCQSFKRGIYELESFLGLLEFNSACKLEYSRFSLLFTNDFRTLKNRESFRNFGKLEHFEVRFQNMWISKCSLLIIRGKWPELF